MIVHVSHRIEDLVAALVARVAEPCAAEDSPGQAGPLLRETIAVQGRGMERWLSMELSRRLGVWANPDFPFPRRLIERAFDAVLGPCDASARFEPESMTWTIARLLTTLAGRREFEELDRYLQADSSPSRRVQLASRIAQTFDHYVVYRPDMIAAWEASTDPRDWQPILWKQVVASCGPETSSENCSRNGANHLAARTDDFLARVSAESGVIPGFPSRASLFGVTTLPPRLVEVLSALGRRIDLQLFVLRPTSAPLATATATATATGENPLWASLGEVGRQFHQVLAVQEVEVRETGGGDGELERRPSLLHAVQQVVRTGASCPSIAAPDIADGSVQVHACHGPMREVEVLRDRLRALFEADASLEPRDVIVMTPDVEGYAPFIEAAFDSQGDDLAPIDYRVADRNVRATHPVVDALGDLLDALSGRLTASAVVDLLMVDRIREKFGIGEEDLEVLIGWIGDAGIRWGVDAQHRAEVGQPALRQNTWEEGVDRLMLGLAMPPDAEALFGGTRAAAGVEPGRADLLGRFVEFRDALFAFREAVSGLHPVERWRESLARLMDQMIDARDDGAQQQARVRDALRELEERARAAGFDEPVALATVRDELSSQLERGVESHRFLTGGVTFCELVPMRSIPFRVVALLGMNDDAFPRSRVPLGFDLVARNPKPGDRSSRDDDRYLFLEALVSARDHLIVTFAGKSTRDGVPRPPSVVVDELVDEAVRVCGEPDPVASRARLVVQHPLHAFSPRYFDGSDARLFSHSKVDRDGAEALVVARTTRGQGLAGRPWVRAALPAEAVGAAEREAMPVALSDLARFFEHPARAFLQRRFGLYLRDEVEPLEDREPLRLDDLQRWVHGNALLRAELDGMSELDALALVRADGRLPPGAIGDQAEQVSRRRTRSILDEVRALRGDEPLAPVPVDHRLGDWRIHGEIGDLWSNGRVVLQFSTLPHSRELAFWIHHLVLCWIAPEGVSLRSSLVARKGDAAEVRTLEPCDDAESLLRDLLGLYALGQTLPLPFLRETSLAYAKQLAGSSSVRPPSATVRSSWKGSWGRVASDDFYLAQAFRDVDPLDPQSELPGIGFAELTQRVCEPYFRAIGQAKGKAR